jgi:hypothetical protein
MKCCVKKCCVKRDNFPNLSKKLTKLDEESNWLLN